MSKILITGGAGDIGYYLCKKLLDNNHNVDIVDNFCRGNNDILFKSLIDHENAKFYEGDLCEKSFVDKLPKDYEYIYHLAALNGTSNFYNFPFTTLEYCSLPTINLLKHSKHLNKLKKFVFASSSETYACTVDKFSWKLPTSEEVPLCIDDPRNVRWSYAGAKIYSEIACFSAATEFNIPVSIIRFHNVFGPRMNDKHVIPDFIKRAMNGIYKLYGANNTRSFIFVEDAVNLCEIIATSKDSINTIVNIGGAQEISMLNLAKIILKLMNINDAEIICENAPIGSVSRRVPSLNKLKQLTNYKLKFSLEEGLSLVIKHIKKYN